MEFMQFHPTVLYVAGSSRFLISEAVRGEGAYLRDKNRQRFMLEVDPRAELAPRDVVAQAIVRCMERTRHPNVYLDLSHLESALVQRRFPGIDKVCRGFGLDITPRSDSDSARGPLHDRRRHRRRAGQDHVAGAVGRGRSHLERAARGQSAGVEQPAGGAGVRRGLRPGGRRGRGGMPDYFHVARRSIRRCSSRKREETLDVADITNSLRSVMVRNMGVIRDRAGLMQAQRDVAFWCRYVLAREFDNRPGWELQNMLTIARLMIRAALPREESRGVHFRSDFS